MLSDLPDLPPLPMGEVGLRSPSSPPVALSRKQKAAIVVQLAMRGGASLSLAHLPENIQSDLLHQIGDLGPVDGDTVAAVADEFAQALESGGLTGGAGLAGALELLEGAVSPALVQRLKQANTVPQRGDPWDKITDKEPEDLVPLIERESTEVAAVLLSKLNVSKAAAILGLMPGDRARRITYAISQIGAVRPDAVYRIGQALARVLDIVPVTAFSDGPVARVGAILNSSRSSTRNEVLAGLEEADATFAEEVRKSIFTFANIPGRVDARDVPKIVRQIDQDVMVLALAAAMPELPEAAEFILSAMSRRMADALRGEIEEKGEVDATEGEDAMGAVVAKIRELEEAGEIYLIAEES